MELIEIKNSQPKVLRIQYELSNVCNHKCWYCFPGSNEGTNGWPDIDVVKNNLSAIIEHYFLNDINEIHLALLGGEPSLWKHLGDLIKHITENTSYDRKQKKLKISMWSNGSRTLRWWKEYGHYFDHVGISVHHEFANLDHLIEVAEILLEKKVSVLTTVLMDYTAWDKCLEIVTYLSSTKSKFMVLARPVYTDGKDNYAPEQLKYLEQPRKRNPSIRDIFIHREIYLNRPKYKLVFDNNTSTTIESDHYVILNKLNRFFGWECTLGINQLLIDSSGNLTGSCKSKPYGMDDYFNINDPALEKIFNPKITTITCEKLECKCSGEVVLSKKKGIKKVIPIYEN